MTKRLQSWSAVDVGLETMLWAGIAALVIFFCALLLPQLPVQAGKAESARTVDVADANYHCKKWGMTRSRQDHDLCINERQQRRADAMRF